MCCLLVAGGWAERGGAGEHGGDPSVRCRARCHSNETDWPLYSYVAPMSWLVRADVEGRDDRTAKVDPPDPAYSSSDENSSGSVDRTSSHWPSVTWCSSAASTVRTSSSMLVSIE